MRLFSSTFLMGSDSRNPSCIENNILKFLQLLIHAIYIYIFFLHSRVTEKNNPYSSKEIIEEADFCGLKSKLSGFPVSFTTVVFFRQD